MVPKLFPLELKPLMTDWVSILFHAIERNICVGEKQHQVHHNSWDVTVTHSQYLNSNKYKRNY
jgi:hypothetical protein